ncbi:DUF418 domain-containing protein [Luteimonas sp. RD2P54]|uniref:DUF418 domain-containing protein n=1 Tax=Luteimonas endophytica TaxID=3042023 RepID=A0ABT6JDY7_9GAMM|nr:DUF418 domain-containing protein [Luteimonas endophytica]MDH5824413.1 DUF418 domain-containing protein [Luteimonas endophytica]
MDERGGFAPIDAPDRIGFMDALRAVALLGIFLVNIEWFNRPWEEFGRGIAPGQAGIDMVSAWVVHVFVAGKFWILFSLLFGMGFAVMAERAAAAARPFRDPYLRRSLVLLALGLAHALLQWVGDILHTYALAALLLLALRGMRPRTRLIAGLSAYYALCALLLATYALMNLAPADMLADPDLERATMLAAAAAARVYSSGGFAEITAQRAGDFAGFVGYNLFLVPMVVAIFLVGSWLVQSGRIRDVAANRGFFLRLLLLGGPAGLALALWSAALGTGVADAGGEARWLLASTVMSIGALPLALAYLSALALAWSSAAGARLLAPLAPAGRMALTNYLLQSLAGSLLFYGYGLALWGRLGHAGLLLLALAVFALQVAASRWWLARFRFGPAEWLWRWATYGARPPLRQPAGSSA